LRDHFSTEICSKVNHANNYNIDNGLLIIIKYWPFNFDTITMTVNNNNNIVFDYNMFRKS